MLWLPHDDRGIFVRIPVDRKGHLYVSPMPYGPYDPFNRLMKSYRRHRVQRVVVLVTDEEIRRKAKRDLFQVYRKEGIAVLHRPIYDLTCPRHADVASLLPEIEHCLQRENLVIHCNAGVGRTGLVAACVVKRLRGCTGDEAISTIRQCMHVKLTDEQVRFVTAYTDEALEQRAGTVIS